MLLPTSLFGSGQEIGNSGTGSGTFTKVWYGEGSPYCICLLYQGLLAASQRRSPWAYRCDPSGVQKKLKHNFNSMAVGFTSIAPAELRACTACPKGRNSCKIERKFVMSISFRSVNSQIPSFSWCFFVPPSLFMKKI